MNAPAPAWKPQYQLPQPHEGGFWARPAVRSTLRALNLVGGLAAAVVALVLVGLYAALLGCVGEETRGLCAGNAGLVPFLEWPIFVTAVVAPLAGGLASFLTRRPQWLVLGVAAAILMGLLIAAVSIGQTFLLS